MGLGWSEDTHPVDGGVGILLRGVAAASD
jgi:hypothetical protein